MDRMTSPDRNIFRVNGPLRGKSTGDRWIFPHKGQWRRVFMFSLIWVWTNGWANNRDAGSLRRHVAYCGVFYPHGNLNVNEADAVWNQVAFGIHITVMSHQSNGVGDYRQRHCLFKSVFRRGTKKTHRSSALVVLCEEIHYEWPVVPGRKVFVSMSWRQYVPIRDFVFNVLMF